MMQPRKNEKEGLNFTTSCNGNGELPYRTDMRSSASEVEKCERVLTSTPGWMNVGMILGDVAQVG